MIEVSGEGPFMPSISSPVKPQIARAITRGNPVAATRRLRNSLFVNLNLLDRLAIYSFRY